MEAIQSSQRACFLPSKRTWIQRFLILLMTAWLTGCSSLLYHPTHFKHYDPEKLGAIPDEIWFTNSDEVKLHGWYFHSQAKSPPRATIVFFHGNGENLTSHFATLMFILKEGYDFFIFDYQGYGLSEGSPSPEGTVKDGRAAVKWAVALNPKRPLVIFGQSLGGAVALRVAGELKSEIPLKLVIVDSTFHSYKAAGRKVLSHSFITWPFQWLACLVLSDSAAPEDFIPEISPIPMVVIHGTADKAVDYSLGEKVFELARDPKEFWKIEGGSHIDALWRPKAGIRERFVQALEKSIKTSRD